MYCKNCGNELKDSDKYCFSCGNEIDEKTEIVTDIENNNKNIEDDITTGKIDRTVKMNLNRIDKVNNYLPLSIVAIILSVVCGLVFCNIFALTAGLIFSIFGCMSANKVDDYLKKGDIEEAVKNSKKQRTSQ